MNDSSSNDQTKQPLLTIAIAIRDPNPRRLDRCVAAFAALRRAEAVELVLVTCGERINLDSNAVGSLGRVRIVADAPRGVYQAYNLGCTVASGRYIGFYGFDDFPLPGLDRIIDEAEHDDGQTVLFAGPCLSGSRMMRPMLPVCTIAYRNWCHQGLIYRRSALSQPPFSTQYRVLADHHANIRLLGDHPRSVRVFSEPIAFFSQGGLSSTQQDEHFRAEQRRMAHESFGWRGLAVVNLGFAVHSVRRIVVRAAAGMAPRFS